MKRYTIGQLGRENHGDYSYEEAKARARVLVDDEVTKARRRGHKPVVHKQGKDSWRITLGPDIQSTIYATVTIHRIA